MEATVEQMTGTFDSLKAVFEEYKMVILVAIVCLILLLAYMWFSRGSDSSKAPGSVLMNMARVNGATTDMPSMADSPDPMPSAPIQQVEEAPSSQTPPGAQ
jgi:hypothetical protein